MLYADAMNGNELKRSQDTVCPITFTWRIATRIGSFVFGPRARGTGGARAELPCRGTGTGALSERTDTSEHDSDTTGGATPCTTEQAREEKTA
jgi:hypothetical protein